MSSRSQGEQSKHRFDLCYMNARQLPRIVYDCGKAVEAAGQLCRLVFPLATLSQRPAVRAHECTSRGRPTSRLGRPSTFKFVSGAARRRRRAYGKRRTGVMIRRSGLRLKRHGAGSRPVASSSKPPPLYGRDARRPRRTRARRHYVATTGPGPTYA